MLSDIDCRVSFECLFWQHLIAPDPYKVLANRARMKAYLARYGRIDPRSWLDLDVVEMVEMFDEISYIIQQENDLTTRSENG